MSSTPVKTYDSDPFYWSTDQVSRFFQHDLSLFIQDHELGLHAPNLPNTDDLAEQLQSNDLNGRDLLQEIDRDLLKTEFGISRLKQQFSVVQIIRTLRKISPGYATNNGLAHLLPPSLPTPHASVPQTPTVAEAPAVGSRVRKGELLVEDQGGRKRRKLDLSTTGANTAQDAQPGASQEALPDSVLALADRTVAADSGESGYLQDKKITVDDIFYGGTDFGKEIEHSPSEDEDHDSYENFSIIGRRGLAGNTAFVHRRIRHFLQNPKTEQITYHRKAAVAVYPYTESAARDRDATSVTIFQTQDDAVKVIRERALTLSYQEEETIDVQSDLGNEWSFLLRKYGGSDQAELLPVWGESESDAGPTEDQSNSQAGSDDDMAEEDDTAETTSYANDLILPTIDRVIESQAQAWRETKEPRLEKNMAHSVWRKARGKRTDVKALTSAATKAIAQLDSRLEQIKKRLVDRTWDNEQDLVQACEILEPTVHDREHEEWKIRVWKLKQEPLSEAKKQKPSNKGHLGTPLGVSRDDAVEDDDMRDFIEEDSFEDARESLSDDGNSLQQDDDMSDKSSTTSPQEAELPDEFEEKENRPGVIDLDEDTDDAETPSAFDHDDEHSRQPSVESEPPELPAAMDVDAPVFKTPKKPEAVYLLDPASPPLPSPSTFVPRPSQSATKNAVEVIEIPSSPAKPPSSPSKPVTIKRETPVFSDNPDKDSVTAILNWKYKDLENNDDRRRLMLKMAFELEETTRKLLIKFLTGNMTSVLSHTQEAIGFINAGAEDFPDYNAEESEAMRYAARLYKCWIHIDHTLFNEDVSVVADKYVWPFEDEKDFDDDVRNWHNTIKLAIQRVERFSTSKAKEYIVIDTEDECENEEQDQAHKTPHQKRKKAVEQSQTGLKMREKAGQRAALYNESQNRQSQTLSFLGGEEEAVVPLYAPDDVDASKHVYLNPDIAKRLKPHQIEGVKFMWRELTVPIDEDGQGCLLAHTMGLGKTAQSLALLTAIAETAKSEEKRSCLPTDLRRAKNKLRVLVLCPPSLLENWRQEVSMWCPKSTFNVFILNSANSSKVTRLDEIRSWRSHGGIMLCGYTMFARLVHGKSGGKSQAFTEEEQKMVEANLLHKTHLVIADEVHSIKNDASSVSLAAHKIKTVRRIGLTGSPMSNNTSEIFALINWVAPEFLGSKVEFKAIYEEPIVAGTYVDSSAYERRRSKIKLKTLSELIEPKLNRADITVLKGSLKSKVEFVLTIPLTDSQKLGYERYVETIMKSKSGEEGTAISQVKLFGWLAILQLLCNHPKIFRDKLLEEPKEAAKSKKGKKARMSLTGDEIPQSTLEAAGASATPRQRDGRSPSGDEHAYADEHVSQYDINKAMIDRILDVIPNDAAIEMSYKTMIVQKIMNLSIAAGDKVLIFSQSIPSLNFLHDMLKECGVRYGRIQGDVTQDKREKVLQEMQRGKLDVLLISTRAGGLGLNIQQANRVIIFDYAFNPTWEEQAVGRAYRLGQTKPVFVYRFVAGGTFEWKLYDKQLFKTALSSRVVDRRNPVRNNMKKPAEWLVPPGIVEQGNINEEAGKDEHVMDKIITSHAEGNDSFIRGIKTMETLMEESNDEALTAEELKEVELDVEAAKTRKKNGFDSRPTLAPPPPRGSAPSVPGFGPGFPLGTLPVNRPAGISDQQWEQARMEAQLAQLNASRRRLENQASQNYQQRLAEQILPPENLPRQNGSPGTPSRIHGRY